MLHPSEMRREKERLLALAGARFRQGDATSSDPEEQYGPPTTQYNPQPHHLEIEQQLRRGRRHNLLVGGSRSGKTFLFVKHIVRRALLAPDSRHAMFRFRGNAVRATLRLDTLPKVLRLCYPRLRLHYHDQDGYASLPNGSEIWWAGLDEKDRVEKVLGMEFATTFLNESSQIRYSTVLMVRTRLAQVCRTTSGKLLAQQELIDLNPTGKGHYTYREHVQRIDPETRRPLDDEHLDEMYCAFLQPRDNAANLSPQYLAGLARAPARFRKRFFEGQYADDIEGALWTMESLEQIRRSPTEIPATMDRVVIGVDPSGTDGDEDKRSDEVGIVAVGREGSGEGSRAWLLEDATCNLAPIEWGKRVVAMYVKWGADRIVAEANFGGAMVAAVIDAAARSMNVVLPPVQLVTASRGKAVRAEPISVLAGHDYNGEWVGDRIRHAGEFPQLEEELLAFTTHGYTGDRSPNRGDAYVWALTDLMLGDQAPSLWSSADVQVVD